MIEDTKSRPLFTVFTATYNRGLLLERVYKSLCAQKLKNFEWLIVDDGSTDDTRQIVTKMADEGLLKIRYFQKENGGVHTAHNLAIEKAEGYFFVRCDSDDELLSNALDYALKTWNEIKDNLQSNYSGILLLDEDEDGHLIGDEFPNNGGDCSWRELSEISGDKMRVYKTEILRKFPFPVFKGERFVPEGLVWGRIHEIYKMRCVNLSAMRVYRGGGDRLSWQVNKLRYICPNGYAAYYLEEMRRPHSIIKNIALSINYNRVMYGMNRGIFETFRSNPKKNLAILCIPVGIILYKIDSMRDFSIK